MFAEVQLLGTEDCPLSLWHFLHGRVWGEGEALARGGERVDHLLRVDKRGPMWPKKVTPANPQTGNMSAAT